MKRFLIRQLEKFSDIKTHTIRTWEKRYGVFSPLRSTGNIRYYSADDLQRLLYLVLLSQAGNRISMLKHYNTKDLKKLASAGGSNEEKHLYDLYELIISLYKCDTEEFEAILEKSQKFYGYDHLVHRLIVPFLQKTEILSYKDSDAEIHFAVTAVRQKLLVAIDQVTCVADSSKKAVLYLPEGEHYDLMLLYIYYCLKCKGYKVYYLGTNISDNSLKSVIDTKCPDEVYVYLASLKKYSIDEMVNFAMAEYPKSKFTIISGERINEEVSSRVKITHFSSFYPKILNTV